MVEHWPTIVSAVAVGGMAIFVKTYYVPRSELDKFKKECERMRTICQTTTCKMIQNTKEYGLEKTDVLALGARNNVETLTKIRDDITNIRVDMSALRAALVQFLKDQKSL